jgi:hypothetical protein
MDAGVRIGVWLIHTSSFLLFTYLTQTTLKDTLLLPTNLSNSLYKKIGENYFSSPFEIINISSLITQKKTYFPAFQPRRVVP